MWMKPDTGDEAMGRSSHRTSRGERGQRAGTDQSRNLGDPAGEGQQQPPAGINNRGRPGRKSERPIVAGKCGNFIPRLIAKLNRHLKGWGNYFNGWGNYVSYGVSGRAYRKIKWHAGCQLATHLNPL